MEKFQKLAHILTVTVLTFTVGSSMAGIELESKFNPNNLPPCPKPDLSKKTDTERFAKWTKCWGRYKFELDRPDNLDVYEGEWWRGMLHGWGAFTKTTGAKYVGEIKYFFPNGEGIGITSDGRRFEGIWESGKLIREVKVNLPNLKNNIATNTDRTDIDRERQQLAEVRPKNESQTNENGLTYEIFAIKPQFDWVGSFKDGLAAVRVGDSKSGKYGFISKQGQIVIPLIYDQVNEFDGGVAAVRVGDHTTGKWGFIDKKGIFVIKPQFDYAHRFREGLAGVRVGDFKSGKTGFIDITGSFVINPIFDNFATEFSEGFAPVKVGPGDAGKWSFIDKQGRAVIEPTFDWVGSFKDGLAAVRVGDSKSGKYGSINKQGQIVTPLEFDVPPYFQDGLAAVRVGDHTTGKWGFIDKKGIFVIKPQFDYAGSFREGLADVRIGDLLTGKAGFIDKRGNFVINPQFDHSSAFVEGIAEVRVGRSDDARTGYINRQGEFLVLPQFHNYVSIFEDLFIYPKFSEGFAANCVVVNSKRKCGFISKDSIQVIQANNPLQKERLSEKTKQFIEPLVLTVSSTQADANGFVIIKINTNSDTSSLKINGEEQGGRSDGNYVIKKVARVGQDTQFKITATDINGNSDTKTITVTRQADLSSSSQISVLKPETINRSKARDAVAIIIGIQNYKRVPNAEFANNDAREFSEYAIRALGIKPEKIKMLLDDEADEVNIVKAFENWLPIQVNKDKTDVYVFYSGHGLPSSDGKSLYFLPHGVDKELLSRTAVAQNDIIAVLAAAKPNSVTMFIDACYSGQTRGGDVLLANTKPVALKADKNAYPPNFTVITASANDQISSSSPDLKHGIFSFYLMKGMEGEADANKDGRITVGEMQDYLSDKVARQAMTLNRKQTTQLVGDAERVLVGK